ncbi:MAG: hypothetical protein AB8G22_25250 [Saprospiraceae bacterium]
MLELLDFAVTTPNILYTILLLIVLLYWVFVIIGALDMGAVDFEVDVDADVDVDAEVDGSGNIAGALQFFNFGQLPFMVIMTVWILSAWVMGILSNFHYGNGSLTFAAIWLLPIFCLGLIITKIVTTPLIPIFKNLDTHAEEIDYIGQIGKVTLSADNKNLGQAEIIVDNNNALISIKSTKGALKKGSEIVIVEEVDGKYFLVEAMEDSHS